MKRASRASLARGFEGKENRFPLAYFNPHPKHAYSKDPGRTIVIVSIRIVTGQTVMMTPTNNTHDNNCTNKVVAIIHN